jgi:chromosome segregation ATPase
MALFNRTPKATVSDLDLLRSELEALRAELTKRTNELSFVTAATNGLDQRINAIDSRLSNMTSELTHQLHELGNEIQTITEQQQDPASVAALEQLRVNQTRIANEQARYEIAFRQDLATPSHHINQSCAIFRLWYLISMEFLQITASSSPPRVKSLSCATEATAWVLAC